MPKPFEREGSIYLWFGVRYYKYLLRIIGWEKIIRKDHQIKNNMASLIQYNIWTQGSEAIHLFASIYVFVFIIWMGWTYSIGKVFWLILINIIANVYPVMLQRYNRPRIIRLIQYQKMLMKEK